MEDASIVLPEALLPGYHAVQQFGACGEGADGSQQPAVPWKDRQRLPREHPVGVGLPESKPCRCRTGLWGPLPPQVLLLRKHTGEAGVTGQALGKG